MNLKYMFVWPINLSKESHVAENEGDDGFCPLLLRGHFHSSIEAKGRGFAPYILVLPN
jgi:hypothetical protein